MLVTRELEPELTSTQIHEEGHFEAPKGVSAVSKVVLESAGFINAANFPPEVREELLAEADVPAHVLDATFESLYLEYYHQLVSYVGKLLGSRVDAADVVQESFLAAYRTLENFGRDGRVRPRSWLYTITHNKTISHLRDQQTRAEDIPHDGVQDDYRMSLIQPVVQKPREPEHVVELSERMREISDALGSMPAIYRDSVLLKEMGFSLTEIAQKHDVTPKHIKATCFQAKEQLKAIIDHIDAGETISFSKLNPWLALFDYSVDTANPEYKFDTTPSEPTEEFDDMFDEFAEKLKVFLGDVIYGDHAHPMLSDAEARKIILELEPRRQPLIVLNALGLDYRKILKPDTTGQDTVLIRLLNKTKKALGANRAV